LLYIAISCDDVLLGGANPVTYSELIFGGFIKQQQSYSPRYVAVCNSLILVIHQLTCETISTL